MRFAIPVVLMLGVLTANLGLMHHLIEADEN